MHQIKAKVVHKTTMVTEPFLGGQPKTHRTLGNMAQGPEDIHCVVGPGATWSDFKKFSD